MRCRWTSWSAVVASSVLLFAPTPAWGQTRDPAAARVLFNEGRKLASQGHFAEACPKFEESARLDDGIGTRFNLADCWEHIGRTASAWSLFLDVAASAKSAAQPDREKVARQRASTLEPQLARLTIRVDARDSDLEVRKNEISVGRALWGTATPVDPGTYVIEARAAGKKSWRTTIVVAPRAPAATIVVPELEGDATPKDPARAAKNALPEDKGALGAGPGVVAGGMEAETGRSSNSLRTAGWVTGAAGVVGIGVGAAFAAMTKSADNQVASMCTGGAAGNQCADEFERLEFNRTTDIAKNRATVAYVGFIAGGVALATGAVLVLASGSRESATGHSQRKTVVAPLLGASTLGIGMAAVW